MSAFLVETETLDRITLGLFRATNGSRGPNDSPEPRMEYHTGALRVVEVADAARLGQQLWELNLRALQARYNAGLSVEAEAVSKGYTVGWSPLDVLEQVQFAKSLDCLIYQCSEGEVQQEDLYLQLEAYRDQLNAQIVGALPAYDKAAWG